MIDDRLVDGSINLFDTVEEGELSEEARRLERDRESALLRHRAERRRKLFISVILAGTTVYIAALNAIKVLGIRESNTRLEVRIRSAITAPAEYLVLYEDTGDGSRAGAEPIVEFDGRRLPTTMMVSPGPDAIQIFPVNILMPVEAVRGVHEGEIVLRKMREDGGIREYRIPVNLRVPSLLDEWWLLAAWFGLLLIILLGLAGFNLYWYPAPRGVLVCSYMIDGIASNLGSVSVPLKSPWSWLPVSRRSFVDLRRLILNQSFGRTVSELPEFNLEFERLAIGHAVLVTLDLSFAQDRARVFYSEPSGGDHQGSGSPSPLRVRITQGRSLWYRISLDEDWLAFQIDLNKKH